MGFGHMPVSRPQCQVLSKPGRGPGKTRVCLSRVLLQLLATGPMGWWDRAALRPSVLPPHHHLPPNPSLENLLSGTARSFFSVRSSLPILPNFHPFSMPLFAQLQSQKCFPSPHLNLFLLQEVPLEPALISTSRSPYADVCCFLSHQLHQLHCKLVGGWEP